MNQYEVFKSFYSEEEAASMLGLLLENGIDAKVEKTRVILDKLFTGDDLDAGIHLKLHPRDFYKANEVIDEHIKNNLADIEKDYYLFSFSDEELKEIIHKPDEWNNQDYILAKMILEERGVAMSAEQVKALKKERLLTIAKPERAKTGLIITTYILAVSFSIVAFFMALYMYTAKKILPDGSKTWSYDARSREHWLAVLIISSTMTILFFITKIYASFLPLDLSL